MIITVYHVHHQPVVSNKDVPDESCPVSPPVVFSNKHGWLVGVAAAELVLMGLSSFYHDVLQQFYQANNLHVAALQKNVD